MNFQLSRKKKGSVVPMNVVFYLFIIVCLNLLFTSCQKEVTLEAKSETSGTTIQSSAESDAAVLSSPTKFGVYLTGNDIDQKMTVSKSLGVEYIRYTITLKDFTGTDRGYEKWVNAGYKVLLNLDYDHVYTGTNRKAVGFPTNMTEYKKLLEQVLDKYQPEVAVIENEPTTDKYYSGPMSDYITELKTAVYVCKQRGIKVADGATNMQWLEQLMNGSNSKDANYLETKQLIQAYKTIDLDYVNVHSKAPFDSGDNPNVYPTGVPKNVAAYIKTQTGKDVMCNEYNQRNSSTSLMTSAVNEFETGGFRYFTPRSGGGTDFGYPLNQGTSLTPIGKAYQYAIN